MQDGWHPRSSTWESAYPAQPALPSLRSVAPASVSATMTSSTTGAASSAADQPSYRVSASSVQHQARSPSPYKEEYQHYHHQQQQRAEQEQKQYSPEYARYAPYEQHQTRQAASGFHKKVYVKQEVTHEPPRAVYSAAPHVFAPSPPRVAAPALPKLSHMLRASSLNDVQTTRQTWTQEPEAEPEYGRRPAEPRAPADLREVGTAKSSIGFILGGQDHATYMPSSTAMIPPARAMATASSGDTGYYNQHPPHQPAPPSMTVHSSPPVYWRQGANDAVPASRYAPSAHSLASTGRAASAPVLSAASMQRKIETARPASRTCKFEGCEQYVVDHGLCVRHGGGKRCLTEGCTSRAKHFGRCWRHGGSIECKVEGCINRAKSRGYCWSHGGGTKCKAHPCEKIAISNGLCWAHGGGKRCVVSGCRKQAYERTRNFCNSHFQLFKKGLLPASAASLATFEVREDDARGATAATSH